MKKLLVSAAWALALAGCGQPPSPSAPEASPPPTPEATPEASSPAAESTPQPESKPKTLYVTTEFRAVSQLGTHEFPVGTPVELLEEQGEDYVVQHGDVAVRIHRSYFSETLPLPPPPTVEATPAPEPSPDLIPMEPQGASAEESLVSLPQPAPEPWPASSPAPPPTPEPLTAEQQKVEELTESIRQVDQRLREAQNSGDTKEAQRLRREREKLSEELTTYGKP